MKRYKVIAEGADIGPGEELLLSPAQIAPREHNLEILDKPKEGERPDPNKPIRVRSKEGLQFKVGEIIGLAELPRNLVGRVEPLDKPEGNVEQLAADKAAEHKTAKAAAKAAAKAEK